jgi:hypothetical protein
MVIRRIYDGRQEIWVLQVRVDKLKSWRSVPNNPIVPSALTSGTDEEHSEKQGKVE